ncbi:unnamed protein product [Cercopithifilaria johnstoni]|uniref:Leucine-rich repeat protein n=1 Tax=Cercopithifilaria johnstoni TaxID=2874296 RepID=A0A8J2MDC0_9BILA|nr:unnamed protein product [Cercopithifilaria johnstoni]
MTLAAGKAVTRVMHRCEAAKTSGYLDLSDCGVMYIADAIYLVLKGYEINKCNLRNNSLTKFPKKMIKRFSNMIMFNVEGNAIEEFPVEVGEWTEMQGMNLSNNKLTTFPVGVFNMKQLTYLDLSGNNIIEIDVDRLYTSLPNLTQLMLLGNPVAETVKIELENHEKKPKTLKLLLV